MAKTTNILDLNNRLEKVEKENVAQNNYNSLKNRPKINGNLLTGDKTGTQLGLANAQDIGNLSDLNTTDKSSAVGAINDVNRLAVTYGVYTVNNATDVKDFIKKAIQQAHTDLANKKTYTLYNILAAYIGNDNYYGTVERQDAAGYAFSLSKANGGNIYQGYYDISSDYISTYKFDGVAI